MREKNHVRLKQFAELSDSLQFGGWRRIVSSEVHFNERIDINAEDRNEDCISRRNLPNSNNLIRMQTQNCIETEFYTTRVTCSGQ
jgi:hypothetical protein